MSSHVAPTRLYYGIFAALMVLTAVTVWVAFRDLGIMNTYVAMTIAVAKATLVILYFMHVRYGSKLIWIFSLAGFVWLVIFFVLIMATTRRACRSRAGAGKERAAQRGRQARAAGRARPRGRPGVDWVVGRYPASWPCPSHLGSILAEADPEPSRSGRWGRSPWAAWP